MASMSSSPSKDPFGDNCYSYVEEFSEESDLPSNPVTASNSLNRKPVGQAPRSIYRHQGMSHSMSDGIIDSRSSRAEFLANQVNSVGLASDEISIRYNEEDPISSSLSHDATTPSSSRSRSYLILPSPTKLQNIKEASPSSEYLVRTPAKRSRSPRKQMFGEHGWLGRSASMNELPTEVYRKKAGFKQWGGKLKERVENLTPGLSSLDISSLTSRLQSPSKSKSKAPSTTRFYVSLSPPFQAKLYSEMELMIVATANQYLQTQHREGRMTIDSLTQIIEGWASKNRPQVIEFLFDQATQRELIRLNLSSFRFYGPRANNVVSLNCMMQNWKALTREMSVRNFCAPDPMVRKNIIDALKVLEMLGAPMITLAVLDGIGKQAERLIEEGTKTRRAYEQINFGTEKRWEPSAGIVEAEGYNPFA